MSKIIIVTANIGQFDDIIENYYNQTNCKFVMFTDDKEAKSSLWELRQIRRKFVDSRCEARLYKWLIHKYFPDTEYSLWIDASVEIKADVSMLIDKYLKETDIAIQLHSGRHCIYQEAEACIRLQLDYGDIIEKQVARYRLEGYPANHGLHNTSIMLRRHTEDIKRLNEAVWANICCSSLRDQLSFNYIAWKLGIKINDLSLSSGRASHKEKKNNIELMLKVAKRRYKELKKEYEKPIKK